MQIKFNGIQIGNLVITTKKKLAEMDVEINWNEVEYLLTKPVKPKRQKEQKEY